MKFIAELCQNHNGDFKIVEKMVEEAATNGASHVKLQSIYARNLSFRPIFEQGLVENGKTLAIKRPFKPEFERLSNLELTSSQFEKFCKLCEKYSVIPMTTCFTRDLVPVIESQGFRTVKVASYDCASFALLRELSSKFDKIFISTGATYDSEIQHAARVLLDSNVDYTFLHCVTIYPTPISSMNINRLSWLKQYSKEVGFSDHSSVAIDGVLASLVAIFKGANVIERHFTVLDENETKDGPVSITPFHLREIIEFDALSKNDQLLYLNDKYPGWESALGRETRELTHEELLNRSYYRGRFASLSSQENRQTFTMIDNWEETPL